VGKSTPSLLGVGWLGSSRL